MLALALGACSNDDTPKNGGSASYDGKNYELSIGSMEYFGARYDANDVNNTAVIDFYLESAGIAIWFEMNVADPNTEIPGGPYLFANTHAANTFSNGSITTIVDEQEQELSITAGTVNVVVSGENHAVSFSCTVEGGERLTGSYKGTLLWSDER